MKRTDLERKLRIAGCYLKREGGSHSLWMNPKTGITEPHQRAHSLQLDAGLASESKIR